MAKKIVKRLQKNYNNIFITTKKINNLISEEIKTAILENFDFKY